jgi:hypothetical protein
MKKNISVKTRMPPRLFSEAFKTGFQLVLQQPFGQASKLNLIIQPTLLREIS